MKIKLTEEQFKSLMSEGKNKGNGSKLCDRGKEAAKAKFDVYPSAYANGYAVQVCKGTMPDKNGNKRCSGEYCKGKNESFDHLDEALDQWFDEKWVNICRNKKGGGHPPCGRDNADKGGYPKCRKASVAKNMSAAEKKSACSTKRKAEKKDTQSGKGQKPVMTKSPDSRKKKNESVNINRMMLIESRVMISEGLQYHLENQIPLFENQFRYGSEGYFNLINEVRDLYNEGKINLSHLDEEMIKTDIGKKAIFEGKEVWLDTPMEDVDYLNEVKFRGKDVETSSPQRSSSGGKAYKVYVSGCVSKTKTNPSGVKQIRFGSGGLKAKLNNPEAKKSYNARHGCSKGKHNDKCKAGYWSCRLPRYSKKLNLSGGGTWW